MVMRGLISSHFEESGAFIRANNSDSHFNLVDFGIWAINDITGSVYMFLLNKFAKKPTLKT